MSKQRELTVKYKKIRKNMMENITAIRDLLDQASSLTEVVKETSDPELQERLAKSVASLYKSIDALIDQSNELFNSYMDFAETIADD